ncbi:UDP-galactopyranose mutase [Alteromonas pelagimontana]|uniref:UDP-galactopyranose mutase n=1 Tax=Alteromonas pelagimontana TaxID=1858656 RepID=A0A6N3IZP5_9ALTE|nr:UDP-galactopyranose mutase [Alteromonas pelagimontana]
MTPDVIVIGAGFSGAVMAERLAATGKKVLILEQRDQIAGNCYDYRNEAGIMIHQYGPHLFHTNKPEVWDYLSRFTDWHPYEHKVLSRVDGKLVPMPFNLNTLDRLYPKHEAKSLSRLLIARYGEGAKVPILDLCDAAEPALEALGKLVYDKFFVNYTTKQWGVKPEDISAAVTARVPVVISRDNRYFHDKWQAIPKDGYTAMFRKMLASNSIKVELNVDATTRLRLDQNTGEVFFDGSVFNGHVIFTGRLDALFNYVHGELPYRSLQFVYEEHSEDFYQPVTTVNYPNEHAFTRITEFKHILPVDTVTTTIVKEFPQDFDRHDPKRNVPYYPVFNDDNQNRYNDYRALLQAFPTLTVLGRLADYRYYNMDDAVANALYVYRTRAAVF